MVHMQAWENFLTQQEAELGADTVSKWLRSLKMIRFDACNLYLEARDSFQASWFEEHIRPKILSQLYNNNKRQIAVHLSIFSNKQGAKEQNSKEKTRIKPTGETAAALKFSLIFDTIDPYFRFENFLESPSNELAFKILSNLKKSPSQTGAEAPVELATFNPIYIYGPTGRGKTHLLMATAHQLRESGLKVIYTRGETFTEHVISAIRAGEMSLFRQAYRNIDVLIVDDVNIFSRKTATQEEFFHSFNTLHLSGKQIILSANVPPQELQFIEPRLISRFEWGIALSLDPLSNEELAIMLQKKAALLNFKVSPKIIAFLIETFPSGGKAVVKALQALILRIHLDGHSSSMPSPSISIAQAKEALKDLINEENEKTITPQKILLHVAEHFGIKVEDILGKTKSRDCVFPRQISMFFCRKELKIPFVKIGNIFSKDHSTVMSSIKLIQTAIDNKDPDTCASVDTIRKKIKA